MFSKFFKSFHKKFPWKNHLFLPLIILTIISGLASLFLATSYFYLERNIINNTKVQSEQEIARAAKEIDVFMHENVPPSANMLADDMSKSRVPKDKIVERLQKKSVNLNGLGVAYAPYAFDQDIKLYAPYFTQKNGKQLLIPLEGIYDYTEQPRYKLPFQHGAMYINPFYDPASETIVAEYGAPFFDRNGNKIGVAFANVSTDNIQYRIQKMKLGFKGYGFVISQNGSYITHPDKQLVVSHKTIFDTAKSLKNPSLEKIATAAIKGKKEYIDLINKTNGQESWMFFEPIPSTGWTLGGVFLKDELDLNTDELRQKRIQIVLALMFFFIFLSLIALRIDKGTDFALWAGSLLFSLFMACAIIYMWRMAHLLTRFKLEEEGTVMVQDRTTLNRFLETAEQAAQFARAAQVKELNQMSTAESNNNKLPSDIKAQPEQVVIPQNPASTGAPTIAVQQMQHAQKPKNIGQHVDTSSNIDDKEEVSIICPIGITEGPSIGDVEATAQAIANSVKDASNFLIKNIAKKALPKNREVKLEAPKPVITSPRILQEIKAKEEADNAPPVEAPIILSSEKLLVPTGLYLTHLDFENYNTVKFIGQFWQRYVKGIQDDIKRGIIFPSSESITSTPAYQYDEDPWEVVGWNIQGKVSQRFNYSTYPFDTKLIRIQMWPSDFDKGVILAADLDAYKELAPSALPGIDPGVKFTEWRIDSSFFSYQRNDYLTNFGHYISGPFGIVDQSKKSATPELYFNVSLGRYILSILMLDLFPIIVILAMLFMLLFLMSHHLVKSVNDILITTASLFFTVILAHTHFKTTIPVEQIVFFEYFYFILDFLIIFISIIALLFFLKADIAFIRYRNLLLPQLLFWPLVTSFVLILSLIYFY